MLAGRRSRPARPAPSSLLGAALLATVALALPVHAQTTVLLVGNATAKLTTSTAELRVGARLDFGEAMRLELSALRRGRGRRDIGFQLQGRWQRGTGLLGNRAPASASPAAIRLTGRIHVCG